jgi:transcriptional regulator with XRE-family HTH domain
VITGTDVVAKRASLGLSRKAFAQRCGLTEGVLWRIEKKGVISSAETAKIEDEFFSGQAEPGTVGHDDPTYEQAVDELTPIAATPTNEEIATAIISSVLVGIGEMKLDHQANRYVSHSEIQTFKDCRRKWWLGHVRNLKPVDEPLTGALAVGTRIHKALELWYVPKGEVPTDPQDTLERLILEDWTILTQRFAANPSWDPFGDVAASVPPEVEKKFKTEADLQRAMLEGYMEWVKTDGSDSLYETIAPESVAAVQLPQVWHDGRQVTLIGRLDRRVRRGADNREMFEDFKTAASITQLLQELPMNQQAKYYMLLLWLESGEATPPVLSALFTILRKVKRTASAKPPFYERTEVHHNKTVLQRFRDEVLAIVNEMDDAERRLRDGEPHFRVVYPRPSRDCSWKCPFVKACPMFDDAQSYPESMLHNLFTVGQPLEYYGLATAKAHTDEE